MLNLLIIFKISLDSLRRNKFRSILTLLGIILGIASVVAMYNLGMGMQSKVADELSSLGTNVIIISSYERHSGLRKRTQSININDLEAIKKKSPEVSNAIPFIRTYTKFSYKNTFDEGTILGTHPEYFLLGEKKIFEGNFFGMVDLNNSSNICVLGYDLARKLFKSQDPIGKTIIADKVPLKVIGVLENYPFFSALEPITVNTSLIIPYNTFYQKFNANGRFEKKGELQSALILVYPDKNIYKVKIDIENLLRERYKIPPKDKNVFSIDTLDEYTQLRTKYILKQVIFLKIIAFIALLAGGINIMNIMLVSVKERTRELGIRMALGARFKDIILQFLAEALFLCFLGGAAGIILSMPLTLFMAKMFLDNTPVKFSLNMIAIAFIYSSIIGIIFGIYPARCAALKDPIESLRYE